MRAMWHVIVGRGCGPGAASSNGVTPAHSSSDGIPPPLSVVPGMWSAHASGVASDDARGEFWAARASDSGVFDGPDWGESAGSAGHLSDIVADGCKCGQYWLTGTGPECRVSRAGDGGTNVRAAPAGAEYR